MSLGESVKEILVGDHFSHNYNLDGFGIGITADTTVFFKVVSWGVLHSMMYDNGYIMDVARWGNDW